MDKQTQTEIYISERIKTIPLYQYRFQPIETFRESNTFTTCYKRDIGNKTIREYILENSEQLRIVNIINSLEEYLRESIKRMTSLKIYFPIQEDTILMDEINDVPIITTQPNNKDTSATYPIEYYMIQYPHEEEMLTEELGEVFFNQFIEEKEIFERKYQRITDNELIEMKEKYNQYISQRIGQPMKQIKQEIIKTQRSLNDYLVSVIFLSVLTDLPIQTEELEECISRHKKIILTLPIERN